MPSGRRYCHCGLAPQTSGATDLCGNVKFDALDEVLLVRKEHGRAPLIAPQPFETLVITAVPLLVLIVLVHRISAFLPK